MADSTTGVAPAGTKTNVTNNDEYYTRGRYLWSLVGTIALLVVTALMALYTYNIHQGVQDKQAHGG